MNDLQPLGRSNLSHKRPSRLDRFWFGACYYPEHWDEATRAQDAERMAAAGFNLIRMGEFAWDRLEPEEGHFDFTFFDEAIAHLGKSGIKTMFCTPTATPPVWLTRRHPEILRVNDNGVPMAHGSRQHACHASPVFRDYSRRITRALADHYRDNPDVVAWQTDNEFHCHFFDCHCANCQTAFHEFLRRKYDGKIDALNAAWGTSFWSQTYQNFTEIQTPRAAKPTFPNPSAQLDYSRYLSDAVTRFQHDQVEILRQVQPLWFITHNGTYRKIDYRGPFTKDLDLLGYDSYPMFINDPVVRPAEHAYLLDSVRSWSGNFIIPEQQSGPWGQAPYFTEHPEPGELRKMTYASIARGADSLMYFRWRTCRFGAEEYWCGILDHDNIPRRRYREVVQIGSELQRLGPQLLGSHVHVEAAVAGLDLDAEEAHETLPYGLPHPERIARGIHRELWQHGYATGLVHPSDDLSDLKLLVIPHWTVFDPAWISALEKFVVGGGTLVIGARTATRNLHNAVDGETLPGCLRKLAGVTVEEYGRINLPQARQRRLVIGPKSIVADQWYEVLQPDSGTSVLAKWRGRHLNGTCAIARRKLGKGNVLYVGTYFNEATMTFLRPVLVKLAGLKPSWPGTPEGVEVVQRVKGDESIWFFINHNDRPARLPQLPPGVDLLTGKKPAKPFVLPANGVIAIGKVR